MQTLKSFVNAVWRQTAHRTAPEHKRYWLIPDEVSDNFDLRQIVTCEEGASLETDFYELYWAHLMTGTRLVSVWVWLYRDLLRRPTHTLSRPLKQAKWFVLIALGLILLLVALPVLLISDVLLGFSPGPVDWTWIWLGVIALLVFVALNLLFIRPFVGDAARYFRNSPDNIRARQDIRTLGVRILDDLHETFRSYDRIIVVGHSLGSVVGYDILNYAFARRSKRMRLPAGALPPEIEQFNAAACKDIDLIEFQAAQRNLCRAGWAQNGWKVTDFITVGCPLTYADVLMAKSKEELRSRIEERGLPVCPPQFDSGAPNEQGILGFFRWRDRNGFEQISPQHAGVFAFTRWVNLYFPVRALLFGDVVGGPLRELFGYGIKDVEIDCTHLRGWRIFSHTSYWTLGGEAGDPTHLEALRRAIDFYDEGTAATLPPRTIC